MDASGDVPARSAIEWSRVVSGPLVALRREVWAALNEAKGDDSWQKFIRTWHPNATSEQLRVVEARWRRGLDPEDDSKVDVMDIGEALAALYSIRDLVPEGVAPRVRRLLHGEPDPSLRVMQTLYPEQVFSQSVSGLHGPAEDTARKNCKRGFWRLVHGSSDGTGFIAWRVVVETPLERSDGPKAWFLMETRLPDGVVKQGRREPVAKFVRGTVHAVGPSFYFIGADCDRRPVTSGFWLTGGDLPQDDFDHAHGIIQRFGTKGVYASRALLRRLDGEGDFPFGLFAGNAAESMPEALADDVAMLTEGEPAGAARLLVHPGQSLS